MRQKTKLRTYQQFKGEYKTEKYVLLNLSQSERSLMAQFRSGVLPLRIETGRFRHEPVDRRVCELCDATDTVEDESHFLFHCKFYSDLRALYFDFIDVATFNVLPIGDKFKLLLQDNVKATAKFIEAAFLKRKNCLYRLS